MVLPWQAEEKVAGAKPGSCSHGWTRLRQCFHWTPTDHCSAFLFPQPQTDEGPQVGEREMRGKGREERTLVVCADHTHHVTCIPRCLRVLMCTCVLGCIDTYALRDCM